MKKAIKAVCVLLTGICTFILTVCAEINSKLPDEYTVYENETFSITDYNTLSFENKQGEDFCFNTNHGTNSLNGKLMLMNIIPVKDINLHTQEKKYVIPCGNIFGIKFYTKGAVVIKCSDIPIGTKNINPGLSCGLKEGDNITKINGQDILSCNDVTNAVQKSGGEPISLTYTRDGNTENTIITPVKTDEDNEYRIGLWIRDSCAGLGTMTFYDPDTGYFASLGHGICDSDTASLLPLDKAVITKAEISSITKGADGITGSINGYFANDTSMGYALINNDTGLYGVLNSPAQMFEPVEIANIQDVKKGHAQILCTLDDEGAKYYDIEITHVDYDETNKTKNLQITATDKRLLAKTGGIIQGMSGSPILQNGKLIGAVTHVLVTNSSKGYGIFAQNMYSEMENCSMEGNLITVL